MCIARRDSVIALALPAGQGRGKKQPLATSIPLGLPGERPVESTAVRITSDLHKDGYRLRAWFPADSLVGYDPESYSRLGFYGVVRDAELGLQPLTVGEEFPFASDPSLWQTLELVRR